MRDKVEGKFISIVDACCEVAGSFIYLVLESSKHENKIAYCTHHQTQDDNMV
jgi:hypothetical protein